MLSLPVEDSLHDLERLTSAPSDQDTPYVLSGKNEVLIFCVSVLFLESKGSISLNIQYQTFTRQYMKTT